MVFDRRETLLLLTGDFFILVASLWVTLVLRNLSLPSASYFNANLVPFLPMFGISLVVFYIAGLYEKQTRPIRRVMGTRILGAQGATVAIAAILFFILPLSIEPRIILVIYLAVSVVAESTWRFYRMRYEMNDKNREGAILVGTGPAMRELYDEVNNNDRYLIKFVSLIETKGLHTGSVIATINAGYAAGVRIVVVDTFDPVVIRDMPALYERIASDLTLKDFASLYEEIFDRVPLDHLDTTQILDPLSRPHLLYDVAKRLFDIVLSLALSIIAAPFVILAALALAFENGTIFFLHERIGKGGRPFIIIKLRSMLLNDHGDPELQKKNRVTTVGKFVRKSRIDELPQLWNILMGDLSFIGPRPELPTLVKVYEKEIPQYWMRHMIPPGLSGWAQIHDYDAPRGPVDVARTQRKLSFDLYYLKRRFFGLDLAIAIKTLRALVAFSGT